MEVTVVTVPDHLDPIDVGITLTKVEGDISVQQNVTWSYRCGKCRSSVIQESGCT